MCVHRSYPGFRRCRSAGSTVAASSSVVASAGVDVADPDPGAGTAPDAVDLPAAFQFSAETIDGEPFDAASLTEQPTVLWFWASWCTICARESATVAALSERLAGTDVRVIGVAGLGSPLAETRPWVDTYAVGDLTHLFDADGSLFRQFGVVQQPSFAFVRPDGSFEVVTGVVPLEDLVATSTAL